MFFFCNDTATTEIYTDRHPLSLPDALPICNTRSIPGHFSHKEHVTNLAAKVVLKVQFRAGQMTEQVHHVDRQNRCFNGGHPRGRSEEHTSELQSLMRISYAVFCLKKKQKNRKDSCIITQSSAKKQQA